MLWYDIGTLRLKDSAVKMSCPLQVLSAGVRYIADKVPHVHFISWSWYSIEIEYQLLHNHNFE